jgi:hypothetical protein
MFIHFQWIFLFTIFIGIVAGEYIFIAFQVASMIQLVPAKYVVTNAYYNLSKGLEDIYFLG